MKDILLQSPVEVTTDNDTFVSIQLTKVFVEDSTGEREVCPEICLICQRNRDSGKYSAMQFTVEQTDKLIRQLATLKDAAISYNKARLSND